MATASTRRRSRRDQGGYVLPLFAASLTVLLGFAGVGVDVWNWYHHAQHLQRAADAGALAGAVFMPDAPAQADTIARRAVTANGYTHSAGTPVIVGPGDRPSRLRVEASETFSNNFLQFFGNQETTITRDAVAEYQGPVPMGSPVGQLCNDPFGDQSIDTVAPRCWLNVAAPDATTQSGDRHQGGNCSAASDNCTGGVNTDYDPQGYFFNVDVRSTAGGQPLHIQAYDPGFFFVGDQCSNNLFDPANTTHQTYIANLQAAGIADAGERYVLGNNRFCSGDQDIRGRNIDTTFIVRRPDDTPFTNTDNSVLCVKRFEDHNGTADDLYNQLLSNALTSPENLRFRDYFRQWVDLCEVPIAEVGEYIVQVRSNAAAGAPEVYDSSIVTGGHNRYALRAGFANGTNPPTVNYANVGLFANGRLPIYANQNDGSVSTNFYLARVEPVDANRTLELTFFDVGDVPSGSSVTLTITPPAEATTGAGPLTSFAGCRFTPRGSATENLTGCSRAGMSAGGSPPFQGRIVQVLVPIPSDYDCNEADFVNGCWLRVRLTFAGGALPTDTTTWSANILGDPVRLVE